MGGGGGHGHELDYNGGEGAVANENEFDASMLNGSSDACYSQSQAS